MYVFEYLALVMHSSSAISVVSSVMELAHPYTLQTFNQWPPELHVYIFAFKYTLKFASCLILPVSALLLACLEWANGMAMH